VEQVSSVEFIPVSPPARKTGVREVFPFVLLFFYGRVLVYFNLKRDWRVFFIGGGMAVFLGFHFYSLNPLLSYVFLFTGLEYLLIALYKRWKNRGEEPGGGGARASYCSLSCSHNKIKEVRYFSLYTTLIFFEKSLTERELKLLIFGL
jgi:hypothetical protein